MWGYVTKRRESGGERKTKTGGGGGGGENIKIDVGEYESHETKGEREGQGYN